MTKWRPLLCMHEGPLSRILTARGTESGGSPDSHEYERDLAVQHRDPPTTVKSPPPNGLVQRLHKTRLKKCYRITSRKKLATTLAELQADLDPWVTESTEPRGHHGRWGYGRTPMQTDLETIPLAKEKLLAA